MYQSKFSVSKLPKSQLEKDFRKFLSGKEGIRCKCLRRFVFLEKLPDAILERRNVKQRLQCFSVALDILKKTGSSKKVLIDGFVCFELEGLAKNGELVKIHLREEVFNKDKKVFFISCFYLKGDKTKTSPS